MGKDAEPVSETRSRVDTANERRITRLTSAQLAAATALLDDLLAVAGRHGLSWIHFDAVTDLPMACVDLIVARDHRRTWHVYRQVSS
jgi:hypothetical protein